MNACHRTALVQDFLDGFMPAGEAEAFRAHLATCAPCAAEIAAYRRVFMAIVDAPLLDAGPMLTERVLERVSPARRRRRWVRRLGVGYAASLAATLAGIAGLAGVPAVRGTVETLWTSASRAVAQGLVLALQGLGTVVVGVADAWRIATDLGDRVAPLLRALVAVLAQGPVGITLGVATAAALVLLWWMRPRGRESGEEIRHVGVLGF
jgi:anti-sigma factor RsiW